MTRSFGDSITVGVGASPSSSSWLGLFSPVNSAVSGHGAGDMSRVIQGISPSPSEKYTLMIGTNDHRNYKGDATKQEFFKRFLRQSCVWLACPTLKKARTSTSAVYTGSWSNTGGNTFGKATTSNGSKVTETFSGSTLYLGYIIQNSSLADSTAEVRVDGVLVGTIGCFGSMTTTGGNTYAGACARYAGLGSGAHTLEITVTSPNGKYFYYDYAAGSDDINHAGIIISNVIRMSAAGYATYGSSDAIVDQYNTIINDVKNELVADGMTITLVDNHASIDPTTDLSDGVHPNNAGHLKIHTNFAAVL